MEDDDKKLENPVPPAGDDPAPDPVPPPVEDKPDDELKGIVSRLEEEVSSLRSVVEGIVNDANPEMDKGPVKGPWTHWRPGKR